MNFALLDWEDPQKEGMAIRSIFLPGESLWIAETDRLLSMEGKELNITELTKHSNST